MMMKMLLLGLFLFLSLQPLCCSAVETEEPQPEPRAEFITCTKAAWCVPSQYVVVLQKGTHDSHVSRVVNALRTQTARRGHTVQILHTYSGAFHGFLVKMSRDVLPMALKLPHVKYIEEDSSIFAQGIPWNLERIIQMRHEAGKYTPPNNGANIAVYLMDTSVQESHREIEGRVRVTDFNSVPEEDGVRVHRQKSSQCDSHGTHIAGVVSGRDSGVARGVSVNTMRVLNCQGRGTVSGALAGLEFIRTSLQAQPISPVIVLLPFVGGYSRTLNSACREMVQSGVVLIAAAGNYKDDACLYSPASEPEVITVGATNTADQPLSSANTGSNVGRCVDLFAPGDDIISASSDCTTCFTTKSGTSQAAALVAGIAAVLLNSNPGATPAEVLQLLRHHSVQQVINPASLPPEHRLITPNMVVAMPKSGTSVTGETLLCRSVWSGKSGSGSFDKAVAHCRYGEEMFSCSSFSPNGVHAGEKVQIRNGQKECIAYNTIGGRGVYAIARCCTGKRVKCQASASLQVGTGAECPKKEHQLTGCSSHVSSRGVVDAKWPHGDRFKACPSIAGGTSHASCCQAPNLECRLTDQQVSDFTEQVELACNDSWTLTGCNTVSNGSVTHGSYARGNTCVVPMSKDDKDLTVFIICCRYRPLQ